MNQLTKAQEEYFKNSKLRDENDNLKVVYHGTKAEFDCFSNVKKSIIENLKAGFFFTESKSEADSFGKDKGGKTLEVYLNLENPLDLNKDGGYALLDKYMKDCFPCVNWQQEHICTNKFKDYLHKKGFDSIITFDMIIAFEPNQIKSIDNLYPTCNDNFKNNEEDYFKNSSLEDKLAAAEKKAASYNLSIKQQSKDELEL